jgi:hypothetical protein
MPNQALNNSQTDQLISKTIDLRGRQIKNAGLATDDSDLVTLSQVNDLIQSTFEQITVPTMGAVAAFVVAYLSKGLQKFYQLLVKSGICIGGSSAPKYPLEIRGPNGPGNGTPEIHFCNTDSDSGCYLTDFVQAAGQHYFDATVGCHFDGTNYIATDPNAGALIFGQPGFNLYSASGQTAGSAISPFPNILSVDSLGNTVAYGTVKATGSLGFIFPDGTNQATAGAQTPWLSNINANSHGLYSASYVAIGQPTQSYPYVLLDVTGGRAYFTGSDSFTIGVRYLSTGGLMFIGCSDSSSTPSLQISNTAGTVLVRFPYGGGIYIPGLPNANPGAGSHLLWYDPTDSNRVKFSL